MHARRVDSNSAAVREAAGTVLDLVVVHGGGLHPSLRVVEVDGEVSVWADAPEGDSLIALPEHLFVPLAGLELDVTDDRLSIRAHSPSATSPQRSLAEALIELYNATGKPRWAMTNHPLIRLRGESEVLEALRALRPELVRTGFDVAEAVVGSRSYDYDGATWLFPVVDLINHHRDAPNFRSSAGVVHIPVAHGPDREECLVSYGGQCDALQLAVVYGFFDPGVPFARSMPLSFELDGVGVVEVSGRAMAATSGRDAPKCAMTADGLTLSHLTFRVEHAQWLLVVLQLAVEGCMRSSGRGAEGVEHVVEVMIERIANANLSALRRLELALEGFVDSASRMLADAARLQQANISRTVAVMSR